MQTFKMSIQQVEEHREDIIGLLKQSLGLSFSNPIPEDYFKQRVNTLKNYLIDNKAVIFGIKEDIDLIGFIWICELQQFDEKRIHVVHFVVDGAQRGNGIGTKLLDAVEQYAKQVGVELIELLVTESNDKAVKFYKNKEFNVERYTMIKRLEE